MYVHQSGRISFCLVNIPDRSLFHLRDVKEELKPLCFERRSHSPVNYKTRRGEV